MPPNNKLAYIHGEMVRSQQGDDGLSYVAVLKDISPEGNGQTYLKIIDNPEQAVYVTKPGYRINTCKKELEDKSHLDMYRTKVSQVSQTLWNAINNPGRWRSTPFLQPKKLLSNPYVYGAYIDYGVILKEAYNRANGGTMPMQYNVGFLDIETDVNGTEQIILITFMNADGRTFVGVLKEFFLDHTEQEVYDMWNKKVEPSFRQKLSKKGSEAYTSAPPIKLEVKYKAYNRVYKKSKTITREEAAPLIAGECLEDPEPSMDSPVTLFNLALRQDLLRPRIVVDYHRSAYIFGPGNVRVTFDRGIRASSRFDRFLDGGCPWTAVDETDRILEIKYDEFLPGFIAQLLETGNMIQYAYSKYRLGRERLEGFEKCL